MTVVERGRARCPRCVAIADYTFVESGPPNVVRYEVRCARCGECYSEVHTATVPNFGAASVADAPSRPPPDDGHRIRLASGWSRWLRRRSGVG